MENLSEETAAGAFEFGHILWELKELEPPTHF